MTGALDAAPACKAVFGHDPDSHFSLNDLIRAVHTGDRQRLRAAFDAVHPEIDLEFRVVASGERIVELRGRVVRDADFSTALRISGVVQDVSEKRKAKERLEALQSELTHIGRLNEMGQMVSALAHELIAAFRGGQLHARGRALAEA